MRRQTITASLALCMACAVAAPSDGGAAAFRDPLDVATTPGASDVHGRIFALAHTDGRLAAVGANGVILLSDTSPRAWTPVASPVSSDLTAVYFPTPSDGYIVGHDSVLMRSRDGGTTWRRVFDARTLSRSMLEHYRTPAVQAGGKDEAVRWWIGELEQRVETGAPLPFFDVWFSDAQNGYAVGAFGLILVTADGGEHWSPWMERTDNPRGAHLYAVRGTPGPDGAVYIAGEMGLFLRLDRTAGRFVATSTPYDGTFFSLAVDGERLIAAGLRGNAVLSSDSGHTWSKVETGTVASIAGAASVGDGRTVLLAQNGAVIVIGPDSRTQSPATPSLGRGAYCLAVAEGGDGRTMAFVGTAAGIEKIDLLAAAR